MSSLPPLTLHSLFDKENKHKRWSRSLTLLVGRQPQLWLQILIFCIIRAPLPLWLSLWVWRLQTWSPKRIVVDPLKLLIIKCGQKLKSKSGRIIKLDRLKPWFISMYASFKHYAITVLPPDKRMCANKREQWTQVQ